MNHDHTFRAAVLSVADYLGEEYEWPDDMALEIAVTAVNVATMVISSVGEEKPRIRVPARTLNGNVVYGAFAKSGQSKLP